MRKSLTLMLGMILVVVAGSAMAETFSERGGAFPMKWTPFQWGVFPPVQLLGINTPVYGWRLSTVYSDNKVMRGLDTGVFTGADEAIGCQIAAANFVTDYACGLQLGVANANGRNTTGAQLGLVNIGGNEDMTIEGKTKGTQMGYINISNSIFSGFQLAAVNVSNWTFYGLQLGLINCNDDEGAPTKKPCVQIGVMNFNTSGFLPFFPLINF